jgi:hypothetical protein
MHSSTVKLPLLSHRVPKGTAALCRLLCALFSVVAMSTGTASADILAQLQGLRQSGCGSSTVYEAPLERLGTLDRAARLWATGTGLRQAISRSDYLATRVSTLHLRTGTSALTADNQRCRVIRDSALRHFGAYQDGPDTWVVLAAPVYPGTRSIEPGGLERNDVEPAAPAMTDIEGAAPLPDRVLDLVNAARERGRRCGKHYFPAVAPVRLSMTLDAVAQQHAADMAQRGYFDHIDRAGRTPADRVKAAGYHERLVGENIAYGPTSVEEVMAGWLASPGHCENIMDPRFAEMGLALAPGAARPHGQYWVQLLVKPASATDSELEYRSPKSSK